MESHYSPSERLEVSATTVPLLTTAHYLPKYMPPWTHPWGSFTPSLLLNLDSSTSGYASFDKARAQGAAITEAEIRDDASTCEARLRHQCFCQIQLKLTWEWSSRLYLPRRIWRLPAQCRKWWQTLQSSLHEFQRVSCPQGRDGWAEVPLSTNMEKTVRFQEGATPHARVSTPAPGAGPSRHTSIQCEHCSVSHSFT